MKWKFKNNTDHLIMFNGFIWNSNQEMELNYPVPSYLGLTCTQVGNVPEPVLFHDDFIIEPNNEIFVELETSTFSKNVALSILCLTPNSGAECRFNNNSNKPIPIDVRGFNHVMDWFTCSRLFLKNPTDFDVHISVTAVEVVS